MPRVVAGVWPLCALLLMTDIGRTIAHAAVPRTWTVAAGGDVQAALNAAQPGDTILLQAGATFVGNFVLPAKAGGEHITLRSSAPDNALPGPNIRMTPSYASLLPKLRSPNSTPALSTAPGAHHYRLMQLEFLSNAQGYGDMVALGDGFDAQSSLTMVPHDLIVDRVYMHGDPVVGQKRGDRAEQRGDHHHQSYIAQHQGDRPGLAGDRRVERPGTVPHREQLPGGGERERLFRRNRSVDSRPRAVRHHVHAQPPLEAARLADRAASGTVKNLFELKNAPARPHRRQHDGEQLAGGAGRLRDPVHAAQPGRAAPWMRRSRGAVHQQPRPARGIRASTSSGRTTTHPRAKRTTSSSATTCSRT